MLPPTRSKIVDGISPPGVPVDRAAALRKAFSDTFKDPLFLADVEKLRLDLDPRTGAEVQEIVAKLFASTPAQIERAREVVK